MTIPIQGRNRLEMRQSIGRNLDIVTIGAATSTTDSSSLIDTKYLRGGDDAHNDKQVMIFDPAGSIAAGSVSFVSDYDSATHDATVSPVFSANITANDDYEMWEHPWLLEDINDAINQAITEATKHALKVKQTATTYTERDRFEYSCLSSFLGVHTIEYVYSIDQEETLHDCNEAWDGATSVTVSTDSEKYRRGSSCVKLAVGAGVAAGALLATDTINSVDCTNYDTVEFWIYSDIDQTAANLEFYLDNTAACASPLDTMSLPAITKDTWTRVQLTMTNPELDTGIISIGLGQKAATDIGACTIWIDYVRILKSSSRKYRELNPGYWSIVTGSTNYLKLTPQGKAITGDDTLLRITGYQLPSLLTDDTTDSDIDPAWVIAYATGVLLIGHAKSRLIDIKDKQSLASYWLSKAEKLRPSISTSIKADTRWV